MASDKRLVRRLALLPLDVCNNNTPFLQCNIFFNFFNFFLSLYKQGQKATKRQGKRQKQGQKATKRQRKGKRQKAKGKRQGQKKAASIEAAFFVT